MTTVAERIAQIQARAAAAGHDINRNRPAARAAITPSPAVNRVPPEPAKPADAALNRRLPASCRRSNCGPYENTPGSRHGQAKLRIAAWLICRAMGKHWKKHIELDHCGYHRGVYLVHACGMKLSIHSSYNDHTRYTITLVDCNRRDGLTSSITVDGTRTPASIARDIENRLLSTGALAAFIETRKANDVRRTNETTERLRVLAVAKAAGEHVLSTQRHSAKYSGHPETNRIYINGAASVVACHGYGFNSGTVELEIVVQDPELACEIVKFIKEKTKCRNSP